MNRVELSVVATLYKSPEKVEELIAEIARNAIQVAGASFELILVDDGCPMDSWDIAVGQLGRVPQLKLIRLARNYGQHKAVAVGLRKASGKRVYVLDGDMEEDPGWLPVFWSLMDESESDVVFGYQLMRRGGLARRLGGKIGYRILNWATGLKLFPNLVTSRLMSRRYVEAFNEYFETELWLAGVWQSVGFCQTGVPVVKSNNSKSTYSSAWKLNHLVSAVVEFSSKPLRAVFWTGILSTLGAVCASLLLLWFWSQGAVVPGWTSVLLSVWVFGSLNVVAVSIVGIYTSTIFLEVKKRPVTVWEVQTSDKATKRNA